MYKLEKLLLLALGLAVVIDLLVYNQGVGLNIVLVSAAIIGATYAAMRIGGHQLPLRAHLAAAFGFLFTLPFALGTGESMLTIATIGALSAHLLFLGFALGQAADFQHPWQILTTGTSQVALKLLGRFNTVLSHLKQPVFAKQHWSIVKGGIVLVPLALIFFAIFSEADPVFAEFIRDTLKVADFSYFTGNFIKHFIVVTLLFITFSVFFAASSLYRYPHEARPNRTPSWEMESQIIVGGLVAVFGLFILFQSTTMFGGAMAWEQLDLTYSEYARQGFDQLIMAGTLVSLVILTLRILHGHQIKLATVILYSILIVETLLVLVSAVMRLGLYIEAYGYTDLRLLAAWGTFTIALLIIMLLTSIVQRQPQHILMQHSLIVLGICGLLFCYSMPSAIAARQNINRAAQNAAATSSDYNLYDSSREGYLAGRKAISKHRDLIEVQLAKQEQLDRIRMVSNLRRFYNIKGYQSIENFREWNYSVARVNHVRKLPVPAWLSLESDTSNSINPDEFTW